MILKKLNYDYIESYNLFLKSSLNSLFYHDYKYKEFICNILDSKSDYILFFDDLDVTNLEIIACFPFIYKESSLGIVYNSLPFFGSIGDLILSQNYLTKLDFIYKLLKEKLLDILLNENIISFVIINNPFSSFFAGIKFSVGDIINELFEQNQFIKDNYLIFKDQRLLYLTIFDFYSNFKENIFKIIKDTTKRNINKAVKMNINVEIRNDMLDFLKIVHYENMDKINGKKKPDDFFLKLDSFFNKGIDYNLFVSFFNKEPIAALLVFYYKNFVEYFIPVIRNEYRSTQALSLAIYSAMEDSFYKGYKIWNWGGTHLDQINLINFKKKWANKFLLYDYIILFNKNKKDLLLNRLNEIKEIFDFFYVFPFKDLASLYKI